MEVEPFESADAPTWEWPKIDCAGAPSGGLREQTRAIFTKHSLEQGFMQWRRNGKLSRILARHLKMRLTAIEVPRAAICD